MEVVFNNESESFISFPTNLNCYDNKNLIEKYLTIIERIKLNGTLPFSCTYLQEGIMWGIKYCINIFQKEKKTSSNFNIRLIQFGFKQFLHQNDLVAFITSFHVFKELGFLPLNPPYFNEDKNVFVFPNRTEKIPIGLYTFNEINNLFLDIEDMNKRAVLINELQNEYLLEMEKYNKESY